MSHGRKFDRPAVYQIKVQGHLDKKWADWFDGLAVVPQNNDETLLTGPVVDQACLHGLLCKVRDLGLPLLLVMRIASEDCCLTGGGNGVIYDESSGADCARA